MSYVVKGAEMPDSCLNCRLRTTILKNVLSPTGRTSVYACLIGGMEINIWNEEKHKDCPLAEIPTPHGDLIEKEPIKKFILDGINKPSPESYGYDGIEILSEIEFAPVIIEAEE